MSKEFKDNLGIDMDKTKIGYYIDRVARIEMGLFNAELEKIGITFPQFRILNWLWRYEELTQKELHQFVQIKPSSLTVILDVLIKKGLVERKVDKNDARIRKIVLTDASRAIEHEAWDIMNGFDEMVKGILTEDEYDLAVKILGKLIDGFSEG